MPLVEGVLSGDGIAETFGLCHARGACDGPTSGVPARAKRSRDAGETAILDAASCWERPRLNRLRALAAWSEARPSAFAAVMGGAAPPGETGELGTATELTACQHHRRRRRCHCPCPRHPHRHGHRLRQRHRHHAHENLQQHNKKHKHLHRHRSISESSLIQLHHHN